MENRGLKNEHWVQILSFLKSHPNVYIGKDEHNLRQFVEGVFWICRTGAQWRDLPEKFGYWNTVYKRFARWANKSVWSDMMIHFADDPDMEYGMIDSTVIRAHPCAAGAQKKWRAGKSSSRP